MFQQQLKSPKSKPFPEDSNRFLDLYLKTVLPQISKALGHERAQFTLAGLISGFTLAANFSRADPGAQEKKETHGSKAIEKFKAKAFPRRLKSLIQPLQKQPILSLSFSLFLSLSLSLPLPLPLCYSSFSSSSLSLFLFLSLPFSFYVFLEKLKVEKVYNAINMLNPTHYKYYKYHKLIGKNKRFN